MQWFVYSLTSPSKKMYIGKTNNMYMRMAQHKNAAKRGVKRKICTAIRKYGFDAFDLKILEQTDSEEKCFDLEMYYIIQYNTIQDGYNMTLGGEGPSGNKQTKEANLKRSKALKGRKNGPLTKEHKRKLSEAHKGLDNHQKGRIVSEETRKKISQANKGRHWTTEAKKKLLGRIPWNKGLSKCQF
jgi:group I intron endonuclease